MAARTKATPVAVTPRAMVDAAVKAWGIGLQGLAIRTIVRTTDRVPRLQPEPAEGNRPHVYTAEEATMVVDGLTARGRYAHLDADRLLTALGVPMTARQEARRAYAKRHAASVGAKAPAKAPKAPKATASAKAPKAPNRALGERAVRTPAPKPTPEAPTA